MTITSHHNEKLKEIRKLRSRRRWRERSARFVAEGEDLLAVADAAGWQPLERYCARGSGLVGTEVDPALLAHASGLGSGTRTLAVYEERWARQVLGPLCVYLHGVHDPGNVGTILRSAQAFGASSVGLGPGTADPFGPKAVRASMGAVFAVPLVRMAAGDLAALPGLKVALVPGQGVPLGEVWTDRPGPRHQMAKLRDARPTVHDAGSAEPEITLLIGSERDGLPREVTDAADVTAHIPVATDSLNAAVAAAIALYEIRTRMARR